MRSRRRCWAASTARGVAPKDPWLRKVTVGSRAKCCERVIVGGAARSTRGSTGDKRHGAGFGGRPNGARLVCMRRTGLCLAGITVLVSCSDPTTEAPRDAGRRRALRRGDGRPDGHWWASPEDSGPSECPVGAAFAQGSAEGASDPTMVPAGPAGAVRAGRLTAAALPVDRTGLSTWQAGDYVLANNRVALLIEAARPTSGYNPWGGTPVGVASVRDGRLVDAGDFGELILGLGRFTLQAESVTVMNDGRDGMPAVVRASGPLRAIPFLDEFGYARSRRRTTGTSGWRWTTSCAPTATWRRSTRPSTSLGWARPSCARCSTASSRPTAWGASSPTGASWRAPAR
jgi:hypothetical protein